MKKIRPKLLDREQAAKRIGIHINTLDQWRKRGFGPPEIKRGRWLRFRQDQLDEWILESAGPLKRQKEEILQSY